MDRPTGTGALSALRARAALGWVASTSLHAAAAVGILSRPGSRPVPEPPPAIVEIVQLGPEGGALAPEPVAEPAPQPVAEPSLPRSRDRSPRRYVNAVPGGGDRLTLAPIGGPSRHLLIDHGLSLGEDTPHIEDVSHSRFVRASGEDAVAALPPDETPSTAPEASEPSALTPAPPTDAPLGAESETDEAPETPAEVVAPTLAPDAYAVRVAVTPETSGHEGTSDLVAVDLAFLGLDRDEVSAHAYSRAERTRGTAVRTRLDAALLEQRIVGAANSRGIELRFADDGSERVARAETPALTVILRGGDVAFGDAPARQLEDTLALLRRREANAGWLRLVPLAGDEGALLLTVAPTAEDPGAEPTVTIQLERTRARPETAALLRLAEEALLLPTGSLVTLDGSRTDASDVVHARVGSGQSNALVEAMARR